MEKLLIGLILKPQGIRGEVKIKNYTDGYDAICGLKEVYIDDVLYRVLNMRGDKDVFMLLRGIADRNAAELLRGKEIYADKSALNIGEGRYFIDDVIGCSIVFSDEEVFGEITDILSGKTDIYYVETPQGRAVFPLIDCLNADFDVDNRKVYVDKEAFLAEVRYEN